MKASSSKGKGIRLLKSFVYSIVIFAILIIVCGLLIRFTPLPERWTAYYVLIALCISCFLLGTFVGNIMERKGILYGALFSILLIIVVVVIGGLISGIFSSHGLFQIRFLSSIVCGIIGGMIGVNIR